MQNQFPFLLTFAIAACAPALAFAQDFERIAPREMPSGPAGRVVSPPLPGGEGLSEDVLVDVLQGVLLVPGESSVSTAPLGGVSGLQLSGVTPPDPQALAATINHFHIGRPISFASLGRLTAAIILHYRSNDRPLVDVILPSQDITDGVVQLVVIEGRLGTVSAEGNEWFASPVLESRIRGNPGDVLRSSRLQLDAANLNRNPFRSVNVIYTPGAEVGTTDFILQTQDRRPRRVYVGYENTGNRSTGLDRWLVGFNLGNVFNRDHQLGYQFTTNSDVNRLHAHAVTYEIPLQWGHFVRFFGAYSQADTQALIGGVATSSGGESTQAGVRYEVPLPTRSDMLVSHQVYGGFDFKRTNNDFEFGGTSIFIRETDIFQFQLGYDATLRDATGINNFNAQIVMSPGEWNSNNSDAAFAANRAFAESGYVYGNVSLNRLQELPADFSLVLRAQMQVSDTNLLPSEQLGAGGYYTVRGYEEREARGDHGVLVSVELRSPTFSLGELFHQDKLNDQMQLLAFWDWGAVGNENRLPGEIRTTDLSSLGIGARWQPCENVTVRFDYGWQLVDTGLNPDNGRGHLGVVVNF